MSSGQSNKNDGLDNDLDDNSLAACDFCHGVSEHSLAEAKESLKKHPGSTSDYDVQIILVSGYNEPERATAGLLMAMACVSCFQKVTIFLMMDAVELMSKFPKKKVRIAPFNYIDKYIDDLIALNTNIEVCSACIKVFYPDINEKNFTEFIRPQAGLHGMLDVAIRANHTRTLMF